MKSFTLSTIAFYMTFTTTALFLLMVHARNLELRVQHLERTIKSTNDSTDTVPMPNGFPLKKSPTDNVF